MALVAVVPSLAGNAAASPAAAYVDQPSGLTVLPTAAPGLDTLPPSQASAWAEAYYLAKDHPDDFGYPRLDRAGNRVVVATVTTHGQSLSAGLDSRIRGSGVTRSTVTAVRSFRQLESIKHAAAQLSGSGLPDADAIVQTGPDMTTSAVVITLSRPSDRLMAELARRFGRDAIVVRIDPSTRPTTQSGRDADPSPFRGGAAIGNSTPICTSAFPWFTYTGNGYAMLTAGHCFPGLNANLAARTPAAFMGYVNKSSWLTGTGSIPIPSDTGTFHGDISLVEMNAPERALPKIYRGPAGTSLDADVQSMWSRPAQPNDQYCTGGRMSGELCGWVVQSVGQDYLYATGEWLFNAVVGQKTSGNCTIGGDSGAPEYTLLGNGQVVAKGILSGGAPAATSPGVPAVGTSTSPCQNYFTDIWDAYAALPGAPLTLANPAPAGWQYSNSIQIHNRAYGRCLVVQGADTGTQVWMAACYPAYADQFWVTYPLGNGLVRLVDSASGKCLVSPSWANYGVVQAACGDYADQKWILENPSNPASRIINFNTHACLAGGAGPNFNAVMATCGGGDEQIWQQG